MKHTFHVLTMGIICSFAAVSATFGADIADELSVTEFSSEDELWEYLEANVPHVTCDQVTANNAGEYILIDSIAQNVDVDPSLELVTSDMYYLRSDDAYKKSSLWMCFYSDEDLEEHGFLAGKDVLSNLSDNDHLCACYIVNRDGSFGAQSLVAIKKLEDIDVDNINFVKSIHLEDLERVPGDVTGRWYYTTYYDDSEVIDFALNYYKAYFKDDNEIHAVINRSSDTTTCLRVTLDQLFVDVHEYVDGEENDAKVMFSGDIISEYVVDINTGEIERIV